MKLSDKHLDKIAAVVFDSLNKSDGVKLGVKEPVIKASIVEVIREDMKKEESLDREVKKLMEAYASQIEGGELDSRKVFGMIKAKLAKEKGIVL